MVKLVRIAGAAAMLLVATLFTAGPAAAAVDPSPSADGFACLEEDDGYAADGVCQLTVLEAQTVCRGDVPWFDYSLEAEGTPNTTATLVWGDPNGTHVTMSDLPLTGSVMWPGVAVDAQGNATDWPGWRLVNGVWVEGDEFDWVRPTVPVTFEVNPTATITAQYPAATAPCANPERTVVSADDPKSAVLAATGSNAQPLLWAAAGVTLAGALALALRATLRRRAATR